MRQSKTTVHPERPSIKTSKRRGAKLKPAEFAMLMEEMGSKSIARKKVSKPAKKKPAPMANLSQPSKKEKKQIGALAKQMNVVCSPWYSILMSRRMSFFLGLWVGIVGMGILSFLAWSVISDQSFLSFATLSDQSIPSPSDLAQ